jgi:hypothetical protein
LEHSPKQESPILAHWTYTREEWRAFQRWTRKKKSWLHFLLHFLTPGKSQTPEVKISQEKLSIGEGQHPFSNPEHILKRVEIRDAGRLNIMEITVERNNTTHTGLHEIRIPVPKGKLREAIVVQEKIADQLLPG